MNNFEVADKIHKVAMELSDLAKIAKIRGHNDVYEEHLKRAFYLEKEAALILQSDNDENYWKYIFLKSAGWLAWQLGRYEEALELAELGLAGNATGLPLYRLQELKATVKQAIEEQKNKPNTDTATDKQFSGLLASADIELEKVKIKESKNQKYHILYAPKTLIQNTIRHLIGELVEIDAKSDKNGMFVLESIRKAA